MQFTHRYVMPDYYDAANLRDDAKQITALIYSDEDDAPEWGDAPDMDCTADMGELVFSGFCEVEDLPRIAKLCDELIFYVTDERAE